MKEKSGSKNCNMKNPRGNALDHAMVEELKELPKDEAMFLKKLEGLNRVILEKQRDYCKETERLSKLLKDTEKEVNSLVGTLSRASGTAAETYIIQQISEYHERAEQIRARIAEAESSEGVTGISEEELYRMSRAMLSFDFVYDKATLNQKRTALRAIIKKAIWDGQRLQLYL